MSLKLVGPDNPKLRTVCTFTDLKKAVAVGNNLLKFARSHPCLGLAANQLGFTERVCVAKINGKFQVFINPQIIESSPETQISKDEGCLSFPDQRGTIIRPKTITIQYMVIDKWTSSGCIEFFEGINAIIIEHEIDHLDGIRCIDKFQKKIPTNSDLDDLIRKSVKAIAKPEVKP